MNKKEFEDFVSSIGKVKKINEFEGYEIVKLKDNYKPCELDCGQVIKNQRVERQRMFYPEPHWRIKCRNCQQCIHPSGKGFCRQNSFQAEFIKILNNKAK